MEQLIKTISSIREKYKINFIVEKVSFNDNKTVIYRLKRRQTIKLYIRKEKFIDSYETNCLQQVINFPNIEFIDSYLKLQFSEAEGFLTNTEELWS